MAHEDVNAPAPAGYTYVCAMCGKISPTRSGWTKDNKFVGERGWDVSCFLNSVLQEIAVVEAMRKQPQQEGL